MTAYEVGRVAELWRYPVKSMGAEALDRVDVGWHGFAGDRRWAFLYADEVHNGFPWLTIRERPELWRYQPRFVDPADPDDTAVLVRTPDGRDLDVGDPALAAELGPGIRAIKLDRGTFDTLPLSLITRQTLADLSALVGRTLAVQRFRPNILVDHPGFPYAEDSWVGSTLQIGALRMRIDKRDQRCVMVNVDPATGTRDPTILRTITRERQACLGVYGSIVRPGPIALGDPVLLDG